MFTRWATWSSCERRVMGGSRGSSARSPPRVYLIKALINHMGMAYERLEEMLAVQRPIYIKLGSIKFVKYDVRGAESVHRVLITNPIAKRFALGGSEASRAGCPPARPVIHSRFS